MSLRHSHKRKYTVAVLPPCYFMFGCGCYLTSFNKHQRTTRWARNAHPPGRLYLCLHLYVCFWSMRLHVFMYHFDISLFSVVSASQSTHEMHPTWWILLLYIIWWLMHPNKHLATLEHIVSQSLLELGLCPTAFVCRLVLKIDFQFCHCDIAVVCLQQIKCSIT